MRRYHSHLHEIKAYIMLSVGFLLLVLLLRTDIGAALINEEALFYRVPASVPAPSLQLEMDYSDGVHMIRMQTEHFVFANMCKDPQEGEALIGHAHVYLDGKKISSVYEPLALLPQLAAGQYRLTVSLNVLPDHRAILVNGVPVSAEVTLVVEETIIEETKI